MSKFVSVYANGKKGDQVVTVTEAFAKSIGAKVLEEEPAVDSVGKPLPPREAGAYENPPEPNFVPAIALPEGFEPKVADEPTGDTGATGPTGATGAPDPSTGATGAPATTTTGGPAVSQPEEASK